MALSRLAVTPKSLSTTRPSLLMRTFAACTSINAHSARAKLKHAQQHIKAAIYDVCCGRHGLLMIRVAALRCQCRKEIRTLHGKAVEGEVHAWVSGYLDVPVQHAVGVHVVKAPQDVQCYSRHHLLFQTLSGREMTFE